MIKLEIVTHPDPTSETTPPPLHPPRTSLRQSPPVSDSGLSAGHCWGTRPGRYGRRHSCPLCVPCRCPGAGSRTWRWASTDARRPGDSYLLAGCGNSWTSADARGPGDSYLLAGCGNSWTSADASGPGDSYLLAGCGNCCLSEGSCVGGWSCDAWMCSCIVAGQIHHRLSTVITLYLERYMCVSLQSIYLTSLDFNSHTLFFPIIYFT